MIDNSAGARPALNDESFTRLLEAAYIMQEHQAHARQTIVNAGLPQIIADIVEIQRLIQTREMDFSAALELIASKLREFTSAAGVAITQLHGNEVQYMAANGTAGRLSGAAISLDASSSYQCVRSGKCVRSLDTAADLRLNLELARKLGARSFLAAPVFRDGKPAGSIELLFSGLHAFGEVEIRAAELMATVAAEVMTYQAEYELKKELAAERATVLSALQKLKPQLQKLAGMESVLEKPAESKSGSETCRACGQSFVADETSCRSCGASRATGKYPGTELQSKWAALWDRQLADTEHGPSFRKNVPESERGEQNEEQPVDIDLESELTELQKDLKAEDNPDNEIQAETALVPAPGPSLGTEPAEEDSEQVDPTVLAPAKQLGGEVEAKLWIDRVRSLANSRGGDVSLALAAVVCAVVLVWGVRSHPGLQTNATSSTTTVRRKPRPKPPELSFFDKTLVALGLAVPPPPPVYMGDPNVKVWVDLQTGLYYCPGNSLYGSTAKGRYAAQSEAQQESFEPAARKPCD